MVNRVAREQAGELLRRLVAGRITNFEYERRIATFEDGDAAVSAICVESWQLYDDVLEQRLTGKNRIHKEGRHIVARWILFLQSDLEYEWPYPTLRHDLRRLFTILTFGLLPRLREPKFRDLGDYEVWPFFRAEDYEAALHAPKFLARIAAYF